MQLVVEIDDYTMACIKVADIPFKCIDIALDAIKNGTPLPKGQWIQNGEIWKCSNCSNLSCCKGKYCPDCGAKMEVEND